MNPDTVQSKIAALRACDYFSDMRDEVLLRYVPYFEWLRVRKHQTFIQEGDAADFAVIVISGVFEVSKGEGQKRKLLALAKPGTFLGEIGLITNRERFATCKAVDESDVGLLSREQFDSMARNDLDLHGLLVRQIALQLAHRLTRLTDTIISLREKNDIAVDAARRIIETAAQV